MTIAVWGLAFKPGTDDIREASSIYLLHDLWNAGATARVYDPIAKEAVREAFPDRDDLIICDTALDCCTGADALVIVTEWDEFQNSCPQATPEDLIIFSEACSAQMRRDFPSAEQLYNDLSSRYPGNPVIEHNWRMMRNIRD